VVKNLVAVPIEYSIDSKTLTLAITTFIIDLKRQVGLDATQNGRTAELDGYSLPDKCLWPRYDLHL